MSCSFGDEAAVALIRFMQTPVASNDNTCRTGAVLQELTMDVAGDDGALVTEFAGIPLGTAMVSLVTTVAATDPDQPSIQGADRQDTIGSQLELLSLSPFTSMGGFFCDEIKSHALNIRLPCLKIAPFGRKECSEWLPYLLSLEELHVSLVEDDIDPNSIITVLQQSSSLCKVDIWCNEDIHFGQYRYMDDSQTRRMACICERNYFLFNLLSQQRRHHVINVDIGCDESSHRNKKRKILDYDMSNDDDDDEETWLLPSLIQAAKRMPFTRVSTILEALLALETEFS